MATYTVHEPPPKRDQAAPDPDRFVFVRDGFSFWAFVLAPLWIVLAPLWMLRHRLWVALVGYIVLVIVLQLALTVIGAGTAVMTAAGVLMALLVGLEAATLRRYTLARRRWRNVGVVVGDDLETAERRFFDAWVDRGGETRLPARSWSHTPTAATSPMAVAAPAMRSPQPASDVIGLFPQPGGAPR
jgi:hypothetical protein